MLINVSNIDLGDDVTWEVETHAAGCNLIVKCKGYEIVRIRAVAAGTLANLHAVLTKALIEKPPDTLPPKRFTL